MLRCDYFFNMVQGVKQHILFNLMRKILSFNSIPLWSLSLSKMSVILPLLRCHKLMFLAPKFMPLCGSFASYSRRHSRREKIGGELYIFSPFFSYPVMYLYILMHAQFASVWRSSMTDGPFRDVFIRITR